MREGGDHIAGRLTRVKTEKKIWQYAGIFLLIAGFLFVLQICGGRAAGSKVDWISQHTAIADYFRKHFYQTHNLFPQYAAELGGGQNIYYFAYYGLYHPLYLLSWLFPFLSMETWFQITGVLTHAADGFLCFYWLRHHAQEKESLTGAGMLMLSVSVVYHTSAQVMFVDYMPFLLLMLIGMDEKKAGRKRILLITGTVGLILSSFYYVPAGLAAVGVYILGTTKKNGITIRQYIYNVFRQTLPVIYGGLLTLFYLLPVLCTLLSGRSGGKSVSWKELFLPDISAGKYLYQPYGLGLTAFAAVVLCIWLFCRENEERKIAALLLLILVLPVFPWILNGGLYIRSKIFLPFLPLFSFLTAMLLEKLKRKMISGRQVAAGFLTAAVLLLIGAMDFSDREKILLVADLLICGGSFSFTVMKKKNIAGATALVVMFAVCIGSIWLYRDTHVTQEAVEKLHDTDTQQAIESVVSQETGIYRTEVRGSNEYEKANQNRIWTAGQNLTTCYSSLSNSLYTAFREELGLSRSTRNCLMQNAQNNPLFLRFMGVRYLVGGKVTEWEQISGSGQSSVYENEKAAPVFYLTGQTMSEKTFAGLSWQEKQLALLEAAVVPDGEETETSSVADTGIRLTEKEGENGSVKWDGEKIIVDATEEISTTLQLDQSTDAEQYIFLSFQVKNLNTGKDVSIQINDVKNKLSNESTEYYNENELFHFTLAVEAGTGELTVTFGEGNYELSEVTCKTGTVDEEKNAALYQSTADLKISDSGDGYSGTVQAEQGQWLITSIPYDDCFEVYVDGEAAETEKVNTAFLGIRLTAGTHDIEIRYQAPGSRAGMAGSGLVLLAGLCYLLFIRRTHFGFGVL